MFPKRGAEKTSMFPNQSYGKEATCPHLVSRNTATATIVQLQGINCAIIFCVNNFRSSFSVICRQSQV